MTDSSPRPEGPHTFSDKIFGINPYSKDDPQHETWESNARLAAEEEVAFEAELLKRTPVTPEECGRYVQDGMVGHFDILARRSLIFKYRSAESIAMYQEILTGMMESMLARAGENCPPMIPKAPFLFELRRQFNQRIALWTAEALKRMREGMATDRLLQGEASGEHGLKDGNQGVRPIAHGVEQGPNDARAHQDGLASAVTETAPKNAGTARGSRKVHRVRGPDKRRHQERAEFEDALILELGAVRDQQNSATTLVELRKRFPDFKLWTILPQTEQEELLVQEFKPRAYARGLTARKFGVGEEAIKKSRQILKHKKSID
jgi:hypothetical protein